MTLPQLVGLDTNCFVDYLDGSDAGRRDRLRVAVFEPLSDGRLSAVMSATALSELLVKPFRDAGREAAARLRATIEGLPNLSILDFDRSIAESTAHIRAATKLTLTDAAQVATALAANAQALVTNDRQLVRAASFLAVLLVDDLDEG